MTRAPAAGSSPRGRGKRAGRARPRVARGLIPAWAGKTNLAVHSFLAHGAHPRVGGENPDVKTGSGLPVGSSPRGRGKPSCTGRRTRWAGLIPAWAGKTGRTSRATASARAHPRVGGENGLLGVNQVVSGGSSPRGRGKPGHGHRPRRPPRLIPAWAGKTCSGPRTRSRAWAHPRVGGENRLPVRTVRRVRGSSPRGRGKPPFPPLLRHGFRLIPAWAGKTSSGRFPVNSLAAHPRVGGENRAERDGSARE